MTLRSLFRLTDHRKKTAIDYLLPANRTLLDLYQDYQRIRENQTGRIEHYRDIIETDIPRTFPTSHFVDAHKKEIKEVLYAFVQYSPVGYLQGQNFLCVASVYFFQGHTNYLSFQLFNSLFDNLKHVFGNIIDATLFEKGHIFDESTEEVVTIFLSFYKKKHKTVTTVSQTSILVLKNLIQWRVIGTLMLSCLKDLHASTHLVNFFLPCLYDRVLFCKKTRAMALAFLFCCFLEKPLTEEVILIVQSGSLTEQGLIEILQTSKNTERLFK